ncbi:MAG: acyl-CoA dehydratase activase [Dehalococcoidia bacterium]
MYVAGVDIGSASSKALILDEGRVLAHAIIPTGAESAASAERVMAIALQQAGLGLDDISYVIATGYGRVIVPFADEEVTELSCHARGAHHLFPGVRTVLDMGGQDCKAIRCDERGRLGDFAMNDKCAAGTGRFLELMARLLEVPLEEMGDLALAAGGRAEVSSRCAVFAESEVISHIHRGLPKAHILAGVHAAVVDRIVEMAGRIGMEREVAVTGGLALNRALLAELELRLGVPLLVPPEPRIVGALGAALAALDTAK